ncbi:MAG: bifunctional 5,10-methylenetetrahydrofolate dehydrogenase/5,10-methenyltetrahydrofolate cyclohydrolase [Candidatus Diapherotrites archaeon]|nr:bifunctional 5,10-methylenetetrahydrofolate dehydrogenase/5,10-methenyltetrahydrofolate cyclohydrolase [Candidatus Diapherotrites archaeon]
MACKIVDCKGISEKMLNEAKQAARTLKKKPKLAVVLVGDDAASKVYVQRKQLACEHVGIGFQLFSFPAVVSEREVLEKVRQLNADKSVNGILVQLPLPSNLDRNKILGAINPIKDVDGFTPFNMGALALGMEEFVGCTPLGIMKILEAEGVNIEGKHCCIVNHSIVVGRPVAQLLLNRNATVTVCNKYTKNLAACTKKADILITAVGLPGLIKGRMIKKGAFVIDAGIAKKEGKIAGDVDFNSAKRVAGYLTPVPGGVGPMTVACLMHNTVNAALLQKHR